jgi:hypothetical protein
MESPLELDAALELADAMIDGVRADRRRTGNPQERESLAARLQDHGVRLPPAAEERDLDRHCLAVLLAAATDSAAGGDPNPFASFLEAPGAIIDEYQWYQRNADDPDRDRVLTARCLVALAADGAEIRPRSNGHHDD